MNIDITNYLRINPVDMALVCISTFIICLVAKHFFWDVILDYFQKRSDAIQADIDAGNLARKAGESFKEQYETQMANARSDAHEILESAKRSASAEKKDILAQARKEADSMKEKAMQDIEREKVRSQKEMKQTITDVAFEAAGKIVGKELSEEQQKKYVDEFIERAGDDSWQA